MRLIPPSLITPTPPTATVVNASSASAAHVAPTPSSRGPPPPVMKRPPGLQVQLSDREIEIYTKVGLQVEEEAPPKPIEADDDDEGEEEEEEDEEEEGEEDEESQRDEAVEDDDDVDQQQAEDDGEPRDGNDEGQEGEGQEDDAPRDDDTAAEAVSQGDGEGKGGQPGMEGGKDAAQAGDEPLLKPVTVPPGHFRQHSFGGIEEDVPGMPALSMLPGKGAAPTPLLPLLNAAAAAAVAGGGGSGSEKAAPAGVVLPGASHVPRAPNSKASTLKRSGTKKGEDRGEEDGRLVQGATHDIVAGYQFVRTSSEQSITALMNLSAATSPTAQTAPAAPAAEGEGAASQPGEGAEAGEGETGTSAVPLKKRPTLYGVASSVISNRRSSKSNETNMKTDRVETIKGPNGKNIVCIGTVWALVGVFTAVGEVETDFIQVFLSTHKLFTSSLKVFQYMIARSAIAKGATDDLQVVFAQGRIFSVLEQWLEEHPDDFAPNQQLADTLKKYLGVMASKSPHKPRIQALKTLAESAQSRADQEAQNRQELFGRTMTRGIDLTPLKATATEPASPLLSSSPNSGSPSSLRTPDFPGDFKPAQLAELLCNEEAMLFQAISKEEFANYLNKADKPGSNIQVFSRWSQLVVYWVASEVCKPDELKNRVEVIKFFLQTASHCRTLQNYNAVSEIIRGLSLSPSQRLLKSWKPLSSSLKNSYQDLCKLVSSKDNYSAYRYALQRSSGNTLPIFKAYLDDMSLVTEKMETELAGNQINFYKFHILGNILNSIYFCQKNLNYAFEPDRSLRAYVSDMIAASASLNTDMLAKLSRAREAPPTSADSIVFGIELGLAIDKTGVITAADSTVPACVRDIVEALRSGEKMKTLGLFRKNGNQTNIKKMKAQIDQVGGLVFDFENVSALDLAGLLKQYFADLPDPLFTGHLSPKFVSLSEVKDPKKRLEQLQMLMAQLPKPHLDVATFLLRFLYEVSQVEENQMGCRNLSVCFAPTLFGKKRPVRKISLLQSRVSQAMIIKPETPEADMKKQELVAQVLQTMIECSADLVPNTTLAKDGLEYARS